ncbi:MAG TPA: DMT family transporter [Gaiellaceae bacterium]|jgi:drug/metabolite transporter (DMT)-like permease
MTVVGLACLSAFMFGAMTVALRIGLRRDPDVELATVATLVTALVVVLVAGAAEAPSRGVHGGAAWPFLLAGLLSPGAAQLFVTLGIREAGASRTSMVFGSAPLVSVTIALVFLGEPLSAPLLIGAVLVVAGGVELARERTRPQHLRRIGLLYAFVGVVLFSIRDNLVRWLSGDTSVPPAAAATAALLGGTLLVAAAVGPRLGGRRISAVRSFVPAGLCFGASYVALFEAYFRGRVTIVSPLVATESLWAVVLSVLLLRDSEVVGRRLVLGAVLIVAGGVLIGTFR